ncbi:hypothetical protein LH673_10880 [Morganella morganii]|uniref:hypothetical protein n=1 Tax=Morganella morganii TaxID=582 RepID=UPI001F3545CD|nr:hypothetical protein [Morganella morganii]MCF1265904.1 hypothetical protein [Morganella morganii]
MTGAPGNIPGNGVLHYHFFGCGFIELLMVDPALRGQGDNLDDGDPELFYFRRLSYRKIKNINY